MAKKAADLQKNLELRSQLESMLNTEDSRWNHQESIKELEETAPKRYVDFLQLKSQASEQSKKILESVVKFYLDSNIIDRNEYIQYKKELDEKVIAGFIFQMEMAEFACIKLLESIDEGLANVRSFEVLAKMQDTLLNITRFQVDYMSIIENNWKRFRLEAEELKMLNGEKQENVEENKNLKVRGTKMLVEMANEVKKEMDLPKTDVEITINPAENSSLNTIIQPTESEEGAFQIDDDLI